MRTIKFRGKRVDNGEWIYGGYHKHEEISLCICSAEDRINNIKHLIIVEGMADWNLPKPVRSYEVIPETVGQFTGFSDKKGTDIYEGDTCKREWETGFKSRPVMRDDWEIIFLNGSFLTKQKGEEPNRYSQRFDEMEVIGNIHDL